MHLKILYFLAVVVHLNFIAFSSLFFAIKLVLFPDISIIACGKVPSILGRHYAKCCENQYGVVIKSLITFSLLLLSLRGGDVPCSHPIWPQVPHRDKSKPREGQGMLLSAVLPLVWWHAAQELRAASDGWFCPVCGHLWCFQTF